MTLEDIPLTKEGLQTLKDKLAHLEKEKLPQTKARIEQVRDFCNFHEDSTFDTALAEQKNIQQQISHLRHTIKRATLIKPSPLPIVELGKTVVIREIPDGPEETYMLVNQAEADPSQAKISEHSPMGKSLLNAKVNDHITVTTPMGNRIMKIIKIY